MAQVVENAPVVAPVVAEPAAAPVQPSVVTHVSGEYVAGLWYGDPPALLPPSTSYVLPFERKSGSQQRRVDDERIKHEQDPTEAKRRGSVIDQIKATTMSVFSRARGGTTSPTNRRLVRKEKKFNTYFKFPQPETLLYQSKKARLVNRHNNSQLLGKLWISPNYICFRESARAAKSTRTTIMIPTREIVCIQRARALKVTEAHTVPEFQPYKDLDSSADSILLYMRDRELHQFTGFWDHKSLEDTYHTMDYAWRPQAYAQDSGVVPVSDADAPRDLADSRAAMPAAAAPVAPVATGPIPIVSTVPAAGVAPAVATVPIVAHGLSQHKGAGGRLEEVLRTAPPYAAGAPVAAPVAPVAAPMPLSASARQTSNSVRNMELPIIQQQQQQQQQLPGMAAYPRIPLALKHEIENAGVGTAFPRRHVPLPKTAPIAAIVGNESLHRQTAGTKQRSSATTAAERSLQRNTYPRMPEPLLREIRSFSRMRLRPRRARRGWRRAPFAAVLNDVKHFDLRKLRHVPAPIIKSQLPRVNRLRRSSLSHTGPSLMSAELREHIRAFTVLNLIEGFRHVTPVENRFLDELRANRMHIHLSRRPLRRRVLHELRHYNHTRLRHVRIVQRTYMQYPSMEEICRAKRPPPHLLHEIRLFDGTRLKPAQVAPSTERQVAPQLPVVASVAEFSPVSHMPWWDELAAAITQQNPTRRLRHVALPTTPVFKPITAAEAFKPREETTTVRRVISVRRETLATSSFGAGTAGLPA